MDVDGGKRNSVLVLLLLALASPLSFFLSSAKERGVAPPPLSVTSPPAPIGTEDGAPSEYCLQRLLDPISRLAGDFEEPVPPPTTVVVGQLSPAAAASVTPLLDLAASPALTAEVTTKKTSRPPWTERVRLRAESAATSAGGTISVIIATISDPIDSGLWQSYDSALQALRLGMEEPSADEAGYRFRSFLPWNDVYTTPEKRAESQACRSSTPGVLLFRSPSDGKLNLKMMLLVGESPSSGVQMSAMRNALRIVSAFLRPTPAPGIKEDDLVILGPTFSGSAQPLRMALQQWHTDVKGAPGEPATKPRLPPVHFISGTATGSDVQAYLGAESWKGPEGKLSSYSTTAMPEAAAECSYLYYLDTVLKVGNVGGRVRGVATLNESGSEFGSPIHGRQATATSRFCRLRPTVEVAFPLHISMLRDAYEDADEKAANADREIARSTRLDVSLKENSGALDAPGPTSRKTTIAQDIALSRILEELSKHDVRHVEIHATDAADAIFLARKIRDVAPDVRLAFFDADSLFLHESFRRTLQGSLVVTPYPFLGSSDFVSHPASGKDAEARRYLPFDNAGQQGLFNAVLAGRHADFRTLSQYSIDDVALPLWIAAIGNGAFVPVRVTSGVDCQRTIYGNENMSPGREHARAVLCSLGDSNGQELRREYATYNTAATTSMSLEPRITLSRSWHLCAFLVLITCLAEFMHRLTASRRLAGDVVPSVIDATSDRAADLSIGRLKWRLYGTIRAFVAFLAITYVCAVYVCLGVVRETGPCEWIGLALAGLTAVGASFASVLHSSVGYLDDYLAFADAVGKRPLARRMHRILSGLWGHVSRVVLPAPPSSRGASTERHNQINVLPDPPPQVIAPIVERTAPMVPRPPAGLGAAAEIMAPGRKMDLTHLPRPRFLERARTTFRQVLGASMPGSAAEVAENSFAQARLLFVVATVISVCFALLLASDLVMARFFENATFLPLYVARVVPLTLGVSPAMPIFACMGCIAVWATGRMARLRLAHSLSRLTPPDQVPDLVSTPLRMLLYPGMTSSLHGERAGETLSPNSVVVRQSDDGFTEIEASLLNSIWRPITGRYYVLLTLITLSLPIFVFILKPPSAIEGVGGTVMLSAALALCGFLIGVTYLQLLQYWHALRQLLKRATEHPIALKLSEVLPFARDSVDDQVSRSPDDLLRMVACVRQLFSFVDASRKILDGERCGQLEARLTDVRKKRADALEKAARKTSHVSLGKVLKGVWSPAKESVEAEDAAAALGLSVVEATAFVASCMRQRRADSRSQRPPGDGSTSKEERLRRKNEAVWTARGDALVVTVTALLINRHVRQFKYFLATLTTMSLILLVALTSYPFEPHRLLLTSMWAIVAAVTTTGLYIFVELDRNTFLSRIAGTSAGRVTMDNALLVRVLAWVVVPLLSVAAAQYPEVANVLYHIVEPFSHALK
jgi:hypothetical protein